MTEPFFEVDHDLIAQVIDWSRQRITEGEDPVARARPASELAADLSGSICAGGIGGSEALRRWADVIVPASRSMRHPMNLAYVPSSAVATALASDMAVSAANLMGGIWQCGAGAIAAENQALRWLADLAGFPAASGGTFVPGGTMGNLSALVTARHAAAASRTATEASRSAAVPSDAAPGQRGGEPVGPRIVLAGTAAHSSVAVAASVMDVALHRIDGDDHGRISGSDLQAAAAALGGAAERVFAVVASAGTTNAGVIDDLASVAEVCGRHGWWLHVDGAYGLAAMASPSVRERLSGLERADSFIVDPHKWLFAPYDCCALVYRDPAVSAAAHTQHAGYLENIDHEQWNPSYHAVQLSRRARGLPLWFSLAVHGTDRYRVAVERSLDTAAEVAQGIRDRSHLELVMDPDLTVVLFRRPGWSEEQMDAWADGHAKTGSALILPTRFRGELMFRMCFVNPDTQASLVLQVLDTMAC